MEMVNNRGLFTTRNTFIWEVFCFFFFKNGKCCRLYNRKKCMKRAQTGSRETDVRYFRKSCTDNELQCVNKIYNLYRINRKLQFKDLPKAVVVDGLCRYKKKKNHGFYRWEENIRQAIFDMSRYKWMCECVRARKEGACVCYFQGRVLVNLSKKGTEGLPTPFTYFPSLSVPSHSSRFVFGVSAALCSLFTEVYRPDVLTVTLISVPFS